MGNFSHGSRLNILKPRYELRILSSGLWRLPLPTDREATWKTERTVFSNAVQFPYFNGNQSPEKWDDISKSTQLVLGLTEWAHNLFSLGCDATTGSSMLIEGWGSCVFNAITLDSRIWNLRSPRWPVLSDKETSSRNLYLWQPKELSTEQTDHCALLGFQLHHGLGPRVFQLHSTGVS